MPARYGSRDTLPLTWIKRVPIYATTLLVGLVIAGMIVTVLLESAGGSAIMLAFTPSAFWTEWKLWQIFTHNLINSPSFFYLLALLCLYNFGIGVESFFGRRSFYKLLLVVSIAPALASTAWWMMGKPEYIIMVAGVNFLFIGVFISYATLYPNAEFWNWISMKWLAFAGIVLNSLMYFPKHQWEQLSIFLFTCVASHGFTRYEMGQWSLPKVRIKIPSRKPKFRVLPDAEKYVKPVEENLEAVDSILDKIAKSGIGSLTAKERTILEKARENLLKKDTH